jgi:hypothetical protein
LNQNLEAQTIKAQFSVCLCEELDSEKNCSIGCSSMRQRFMDIKKNIQKNSENKFIINDFDDFCNSLFFSSFVFFVMTFLVAGLLMLISIVSVQSEPTGSPDCAGTMLRLKILCFLLLFKNLICQNSGFMYCIRSWNSKLNHFLHLHEKNFEWTPIFRR